MKTSEKIFVFIIISAILLTGMFSMKQKIEPIKKRQAEAEKQVVLETCIQTNYEPILIDIVNAKYIPSRLEMESFCKDK